MDFQKLIDAYKARFDRYLKDVESVCTSKKNKSKEIIVPHFLDEVILPIYQSLSEKQECSNIKIPNSKTYRPIKGYYRVKVGVTTVGGISVPDGDDYSIYFTPMRNANPMGEKKLVSQTDELAQLIINQLKKEEKNP